MAFWFNTAEGGSNNTTVTTGNSGGLSGTALSTIINGTGSTMVFSNAQAHSGSLSYKMTPGAGANSNLFYDFTDSSQAAARGYIYFTGAPSATAATQWLRIVNTSNQTMVMLYHGSTGLDSPGVQDLSGGVAGSVGPTAIPMNQWLRYEVATAKGTTTTNGYLHAAIYLGDSLTPWWEYESSVRNTGTLNAGATSIGKISNAGNSSLFYVDDYAVSNTTSTFLGPSLNPSVTQSATARTAQTVTKTQTTVSRIANTKTITQLATARTAKTVTKTQPSVARISYVVSATQPTTSRIAVNKTSNQPATASLEQAAALTKTQASTARLSQNYTKTQTAVGRIANTKTKTQASTARTAQVLTKTQSSTARTAQSRTKTQSAIARTAITGTKSQSALAHLSAKPTKTQGATARAAVNRTVTQTAGAYLLTSNNLIFNGDFETDTNGWALDSDYVRSTSANLHGSYGILQTTASGFGNFTTVNDGSGIDVSPSTDYTLSFTASLTINSGFAPIFLLQDGANPYGGTTIASTSLSSGSSLPYVFSFTTGASTSKVAIRIFNNNGDVVAKYDNFVLLETIPGSKTQSATARIAKRLNATVPAVSRMSITGAKTQSAVARAAQTRTKTQTATAKLITNTSNALTQPAVARLAKQVTATRAATARLSNTRTFAQGATANLSTASTKTKTQTSTAHTAITGTKTQPGISRLSATRSATQGAISRISVGKTLVQTATARLTHSTTVDLTQSATARLSNTKSLIQTAHSRLSVVISKTQPAGALLATRLTFTQPAGAYIIKPAGVTTPITLDTHDSSMTLTADQPEVLTLDNSSEALSLATASDDPVESDDEPNIIVL